MGASAAPFGRPRADAILGGICGGVMKSLFLRESKETHARVPPVLEPSVESALTGSLKLSNYSPGQGRVHNQHSTVFPYFCWFCAEGGTPPMSRPFMRSPSRFIHDESSPRHGNGGGGNHQGSGGRSRSQHKRLNANG